MEYSHPEALVSTEWLADNLNTEGVRLVDASYFLPNDNRDAKTEYATKHIPGAVFFNIDDICLDGSDLPHMLPDEETFSAKVGALGIGDGDKIVIYDLTGGGMAAARVWWTFRVFGVEDVALLNGSLPKWLAEGRPSAMFSRTLAWMRRTSCSTKPMRWYRSEVSICLKSTPPSVMHPSVGSKKRSSSRARVDLPAPFGPNRPTISPG